MKVLWMCNVIIPQIAISLNKEVINEGGWLVGLTNSLLEIEDIDLTICFPVFHEEKVIKGNIDNLYFYGIPMKGNEFLRYKKVKEEVFNNILNEVKPDIVHIFGTEYPHTLELVNACEEVGIINKVVISIQGLCSICAQHYTAGLPNYMYKKKSFIDFISRNSIYKQREDFIERGLYEREAIKKVKHIIGRTTWDKACVTQINPNINYHFCNETLRDEFYKHKWSLDNCEKHSIFVSQGSYPIKGLHNVIEALNIVKSLYKDVKLYVGGNKIIREDTFKERLKESSYAAYLRKLIEKYDLKDNILFTGNLSENDMCNRFLKSHVFVLASSIENSPNSLGEAMLLGVPCISSYVGGVPDMITHKKEGFLYQEDAPYMLAKYICELFSNDELAMSFIESEQKKAKKIYDKKQNSKCLLNIYKSIKE